MSYFIIGLSIGIVAAISVSLITDRLELSC